LFQPLCGFISALQSLLFLFAACLPHGPNNLFLFPELRIGHGKWPLLLSPLLAEGVPQRAIPTRFILGPELDSRFPLGRDLHDGHVSFIARHFRINLIIFCPFSLLVILLLCRPTFRIFRLYGVEPGDALTLVSTLRSR